MAIYFPAAESALSIGEAVLGGTTDSVLYIGTGPVLAQDNTNFNYHPSTHVLTVSGGISSPSGTSILGKLGVNATITAAEIFAANLSGTIASGASAVWSGGHVRASTATLTGNTNITTASGFNAIQVEIPVITSPLAVTVTNAATLTILGSPTASGAGPATITNAYSLWIQSGISRFDTQVSIGGNPGASNALYLASNPTIASAAGSVWNAMRLSGTGSLATITGNTNITTATGFNFAVIGQPTVTATTAAMTITNAATLTIIDAPTATGSGGFTPVITNAYALWVQAGATRFDGGFSASTLTLSGAATTLDLTNTTSFGGGSVRFGSTTSIIYDAANSIGVRNGTNAQTFAVYNTFTAGTPDYERLRLYFTGNIATITTEANGTGTVRALNIGTQGTTNISLQVSSGGLNTVGLSVSGSTSSFAMNTIQGGFSGVSGTRQTINIPTTTTYSDGGTNSSSVITTLTIQPTINFTGATRSGKWEGIYIKPTATSLPTGPNAGISFASTTSAAGMVPIAIHNLADDLTNTEQLQFFWASNIAVIRTSLTGTGTARILQLRYGNTTAIGVQVPASASASIVLSAVSTSAAYTTGRITLTGSSSTLSATSGTSYELFANGIFADGGTNSTTVATIIGIAPTINYTAASKTGKVYLEYYNPINTSLPTGQNAALAFSLTASTLGGAVWNNQTDEDTNYEKGVVKFASNAFLIDTTNGGTGTLRAIQIGSATTRSLALFGAGSFGGGTGVMFVASAGTNPSTNPTGGGILYSDAGAGKWRGSGGTVTTFGPAEPHCTVCGSDYGHEWHNEKWGRLQFCMNCMADEISKSHGGELPEWIKRTK